MKTNIIIAIPILAIFYLLALVPSYNRWRRSVFFEGYLRGAAHANIYKWQTGLMAPRSWLSNAQFYVNTELDWPIEVVRPNAAGIER